jgi:hypothetical protein
MRRTAAALITTKDARRAKSRAVVETEIESQAVSSSIWRDSNECHVLTSDYWQRACRDVLRTRKELAAALAYEKVTGKIAELRQELNRSEPISTELRGLPHHRPHRV